MVKWSNFSGKRFSEDGQGLVEYALILVLVAIVVIAVLFLLGPTVGNIFSEINSNLENLEQNEQPEVIEDDDSDVVVITRATFSSGELHFDATSDGTYNPSVTLTTSPGGVMEARSNHYHLNISFASCPCAVTVTSSSGGSASITVP